LTKFAWVWVLATSLPMGLIYWRDDRTV